MKPVIVSSGLFFVATLCVCAGADQAGTDTDPAASAGELLFVATVFTPPGGFTPGIEGPGVDGVGTLYAVNYERQHTIGKVTPKGQCSVFVELPDGSVGNGIRFDSQGRMLIADYTNHNILRVEMQSRRITVLAHEPAMNQPNDLAITSKDVIYASDPNWPKDTGQIWRIDSDGTATKVAKNLGTTNGIEVSPDERTLYVNESIQRNVWAFDIGADGGLNNKRLLIQFPDFLMDGMRCDTKGNLYITRYGKSTVAIISPRGKLLREVQLTGKQPSNIAFGGPDGRTCYVTMADQGNLETFRTNHPGRSWAMRQGQ